MPNPALTPGVANPNVTQANIKATICVSGFTATIRPPSSYTTALKIKQLAAGYAVNGDFETSHYEEDHLISLELGGHPTDPKNLWPEPYNDRLGARVKDQLENKLHDLVCSGAITLKAAQKAISGDWISAYNTYVGPVPAATTETDTAVSPNLVAPSPEALKPPTKRKTDPRFKTCKAANAAGYGPYFKGKNKEYGWYHDANSDGKVC